ncbi:glycosyltransferase [Patescibacteria group bacterium AH-259-L05]|nr:glycosyltransferase [Patescibacteria group bacterium AH-259-L05]
MDKKILIAAGNYWDSPYQVESHHYAKYFAKKSYHICFTSDAISPFHLFSKRGRSEARDRINLWRTGGKWTLDKKIWAYVPLTLFPAYNVPVLRSRWVLNNSLRFTIPCFKKLLEKNGFKSVDILWLKSIAQAPLLDMLNYQKSIFHITDDSVGFRKTSHAMIDKEKEIIQRVDVVTVTSRLLLEKIKKIRKDNVLYLSNGVDFDHFHTSSEKMPQEYQGIPSPRVIFVGAIDEWFDKDLIAYVADNLSNVSFIFIGIPKINIEELKHFSNVYFLGPRHYKDIPAYIQHTHVGIIPFCRTPFIESAHPIKLYEYMAAGVDVVTTEWEEMKLLHSPALVARDKEGFVKHIAQCIDGKGQQKQKLYDFARKHTWDKNAQFLLDKLGSL